MHKVIFDTDLGVDDAMALLYLHAHPQIDLIGICTGVGNATVEQTTHNCLYMHERFDIPAPIYQGAGVGLNGKNPLPPPTMIHGADGLGNTQPKVRNATVSNTSAADYLVDALTEQPGEITLITVGRLTNFAQALRQAPHIATCVKEVIVMGGALGHHGHGGNISPVAEANVYGDPLAADEVFAADCRVTMVGLDVTQQVFMDEASFEQLRVQAGEAGEFIYQISRIYNDFHREWRGLDGCYVHDSTAAIYCVAPHLFTTQQGQLRVATTGVGAGQTIFSKGEQTWFADHWANRPQHRVCVEVDASAVLDNYRDTLVNFFK